jgi:hypothetical protein
MLSAVNGKDLRLTRRGAATKPAMTNDELFNIDWPACDVGECCLILGHEFDGYEHE